MFTLGDDAAREPLTAFDSAQLVTCKVSRGIIPVQSGLSINATKLTIDPPSDTSSHTHNLTASLAPPANEVLQRKSEHNRKRALSESGEDEVILVSVSEPSASNASAYASPPNKRAKEHSLLCSAVPTPLCHATSKWTFLEHNGPLFPPPYEPLPSDVRFLYDGRPMKLSLNAEEVAYYNADKFKRPFTCKPKCYRNFFEGWRRVGFTFYINCC